MSFKFDYSVASWRSHTRNYAGQLTIFSQTVRALLHLLSSRRHTAKGKRSRSQVKVFSKQGEGVIKIV